MTLHGKDCCCEFCFGAKAPAQKDNLTPHHPSDNPSDSITLTRAQLGRQLDKAYAEGQRRGEEGSTKEAP